LKFDFECFHRGGNYRAERGKSVREGSRTTYH